jgi:hypothetical protein
MKQSRFDRIRRQNCFGPRLFRHRYRPSPAPNIVRPRRVTVHSTSWLRPTIDFCRERRSSRLTKSGTRTHLAPTSSTFNRGGGQQGQSTRTQGRPRPAADMVRVSTIAMSSPLHGPTRHQHNRRMRSLRGPPLRSPCAVTQHSSHCATTRAPTRPTAAGVPAFFQRSNKTWTDFGLRRYS